ncbi:MAG: hypothetical protein CME64_07115 [Halobacteriovoraceae bacterium]|nr:hypothetical protein [Halobacteriovoraceae bacterium]|tara:strand:+ start:47929 stop:48474 length:546 start_codon:yes stop_codon:yes gene_type:complete
MIAQELFPILEEQVSVGFTGRVNVLEPNSKMLLGSVELYEGEVWTSTYKGIKGLKAFYNLCIDSFRDDNDFYYVVEPEILNSSRTIHYPFTVLRRKTAQVVEDFKKNQGLRPPGNVKLLINPDFIKSGKEVEGDEFDLLCCISDYNKVDDIYKNCDLLDYQITNSLVSLRKKNALTVVKKG